MILASLFQDGAVLQRDRVVPVWGKTLPDSLVKGTLADQSSFCRSSHEGNFMLYFPAMPAGGAHELTVSVPGTSETVTVRDILIGDVWLASGQSNMEYTLGGDWRVDKSADGEPLSRRQEREFYELNQQTDNFRFFSVERCASGAVENVAKGSWRRMSHDNAGDCSAVAAWFGFYLRQKLDVPVGLIVSAWGGTIAEAWTSYSALMLNPDTAENVAMAIASHQKELNYSSENGVPFDISKAAGVLPDDGNTGVERGFADPDFDDSAWQDMKIPGSWVQQDIAGNGAVWIRKSFEIPADWVGCDLILHTGGIDKHDISYANGVEIGRTGDGLQVDFYNAVRDYPIPAALVKNNIITIASRGFSFCQDGSFMGNWKLIRKSDRAEILLNGIWKACAEYDRGRVHPRKDSSCFGAGNPNTPGILFDGMINPLLPYALRGVIWYQGESNAPMYNEYYETLRTMIADWRYRFMNHEMPFIMVQLAGYSVSKAFVSGAEWAFLRDAQRLLCEEFPQTFMASAIDRGEELDIHPQDKKSVGYRLAQCALNRVYGYEDIVPSGPEICGAKRLSDGSVKLSFNCAGGLRIDSEKEQSFYVSADGGDFVPADSAEVDGNCVILKSSAVDWIFEVRYAWASFPACTLYNSAGLPASSFRIGVEEI